MAVTTLHFGATATGAGTGTDPVSDRAALFSGGNWSTAITGFDFSTGALCCRVQPGTYSVLATLTNAMFTNAPTVLNPLRMEAANTNGTRWEPPDPDWTSAQPVWDTSGMPYLSIPATRNVSTVTNAMWRGFRIENNSSQFAAMLSAGLVIEWCYGVLNNYSSNTSTPVFGGSASFRNCVARILAQSSQAGFYTSGLLFQNCRVEGNWTGAAGSGFIYNAGGTATAVACTAISLPNDGFVQENTNATCRFHLIRCMAIHTVNAASRFLAASATTPQQVYRCVFVDNQYAVANSAGTAAVYVSGCYFRDSGTVTAPGHYPTDLNESGVNGTNSEFMNSAGGDYRIKSSSPLWGRGFGVADEPGSAFSGVSGFVRSSGFGSI